MFDSELAIAELQQYATVLHHHIRQMRQARDVKTAREYSKTLGHLKDECDYGLKVIKKACKKDENK